LDVVRGIFDGYHVVIGIDADGEVQVSSDRADRRQRMIDAELHTALGAVLHESDFHSARVHYRNAQRLLRGEDFANSAKESVCAIEAYLLTITGEKDFKAALKQACKAGVPKPLDGVIEKLYAWRGNEPGVAHAGKAPPAVERADAEFALNMAAAVNLYLRRRLARADAQGADSAGSDLPPFFLLS
jgi:hypothetical protein